MMLKIPKRLRSSESHHQSKEQEKKTAKRFWGKVNKQSGGGYQKADVRSYNLVRVECKTTKHSSFRVTLDMIEKLEEDTFGADEIPCMEIELQLGKKKVYVIPDWAIELILGMK